MPQHIPPTLDHLTIPIDQPRPRKNNPRRGNIDTIAESLERNGQYRPIVVNKPTGEILAGNHTYAAAKRLGWTHIAATFVDVDEDQAARIILADNRTADLGDTKQITDAIDHHLNTQGAACVIRSTHSCMSLRGVRAVGAEMVTSSLTGAIKTDPAARAEFMALTNGAHPTPR